MTKPKLRVRPEHSQLPVSSLRRSLFLASLIFTACASPSRSSTTGRSLSADLYRAEIERDAFAPAIARALESESRGLRAAGLRALARIAEVGSSALVAPLLQDPDADVASWAAFAAGQIGEESEPALIAALPKSAAPDKVLLALGRAGTATGAKSAASMLADARPPVRAAAAVALGLIAKRNPGQLPAAEYADGLSRLVSDPDRDVRFAAVYGLMRLPTPRTAVALIPALADGDAEIRANAARGLGASGTSPQVLDPVLDDADWRVRVEAVRALGEIAKRSPADAAAASTRLVAVAGRELDRLKRSASISAGPPMHVLLEVLDTSPKLGEGGARLLDSVQAELSLAERFPKEVASDRARLSCALAFQLDMREGALRRVRTCGDASLPAWRRRELEARVLAKKKEDGLDPLFKLVIDEDPRVRTAAVDAMSEIEGPRATAALIQLLNAPDPFVVSGAADALARRLEDDKSPPPPAIGEKLSAALRASLEQRDPGHAVAVIDALGALGANARPLVRVLDPLAADPRPAIRRRAAAARRKITGHAAPFGARAPAAGPPAPVSGQHRVTIDTTRGSIELELFGDVAPRTVGTFLALASSGFFSDKVFHRVARDFVIQGGCPRGDGWGGPGYAIEDEHAPLPFVRGAVGVATSGADTGGSQFFIMHSQHPHLDGGYTLFGRVLSGIEVVDAIQPDDRILRVTVRR